VKLWLFKDGNFKVTGKNLSDVCGVGLGPDVF